MAEEEEELFQTVVDVSRDHDVQFDRDAIKDACRDAENRDAVRWWVEEFLGEETMLSRDEAALYAALCKNGEAQRLEAQDLSLVQGLNDREIQTAIEELRRSTEAIEKQTEILRVQQSAMSSLVRGEKKVEQARSHIDREQLRKWDIEKGQIASAIEELSQSLIYQTSDLEQQLKISEGNVKQTVDGLLKSDDKLLLSLQKLASDLDPGKPETNALMDRVRDLCARLIKHTVEGIRTRLDRIYLSNLGISDIHGSSNQEVNDLREELESLYTEILPVAQMTAEQQFLEPALRTISATEGQGQERAVKAVEYIHNCLSFLLNRLETFLSRAREAQSHNTAVKQVLSSAKSELVPIALVPSTKPSSPSKSTNQARRRKSSASQGSLRVRTTRRSSGHLDDDVDPELQLARTLGITLPEPTASDQTRVDFFEKVLKERVVRLDSHAVSLQSTTETSISSHLADAHVTLGLLRDELLRGSEFGSVRLVSKEIEGGVEGFEKDVEGIRLGVESVDLRSLQGGRNATREQLVERWGRLH